MSCAMEMVRIFSTTAFRLALATVAAFALTAALLVGYIFPRTNDLITRQVLQTIEIDARGLREQYSSGGLGQLAASLKARITGLSNSLYFLQGPDGRKLAGNLSRIPPELTPAGAGGTFTYRRSSSGDGRGEERLAAGIVIKVPGGAFLVVGRDTEEQRQFAQTVKWAMYGGFGLLLLIGLGGGLLVSRHILKRIEEVTDASRVIMDGDLSGRIPVSGSGDELDRLSSSLNAMLERIEQLMAGLREVSDNIAHDLKTPLNRLRNRAEAALRDPAGPAGHKEVLQDIIEEADDLIKTFNALLSIARFEAGDVIEEVEPVDLGALVRDVGELYEPAAEEKGFALDIVVKETVRINAHRQLIGQAVANLIDNALKYGAEPASANAEIGAAGSMSAAQARKRIFVSVKHDGLAAHIIVADHGAGIAPDDRARVLKRFVRLEDSRSRPGSGLGLSLVSAIVRLHGGKILLEDNSPGLRVVITLPGAQTAAHGSLDLAGNELLPGDHAAGTGYVSIE